jgi:membrane protein DedA with SNARE-associated domain
VSFEVLAVAGGHHPGGLAEHLVRQFGVLALFVLVFLQDCGIPTFVPGSILVLAGGYCVYAGLVGLHQAALMIALGGFLGASVLFLFARRVGQPVVLRLGRYIGLTEKQFDAAANALERWGPPMLLITRVAPGTRTYMTAFAGISGWSYRRFALWTGGFCLLWAYSFVLIGRALGPHWDNVAPIIENYSAIFVRIVVIALILTIVAFIWRIWHVNHQKQTAIQTTSSATTSPKEQSRAYSRPGWRRILWMADSASPRPTRPRRRDSR